MATPATIAITPGAGQLLDAVSLVVGGNTVVRETMVIADPTNPMQLVNVTADGALQVDGSDTIQPVSGTITANQGTSPWVIAGNLTHNNAAPSVQNIGALTALANTSAPTYTEGDQVLLSTDLTGALRVNITGTVVAANNIEQWNSIALGSPSAYGTGPGAVNVIGVNAFITNTPTVTANIGSTNGLALDATLTGGTQKTLVYDGTNTIFTSAHPGFIQGSVSIGSGPFAVSQSTSPWIVAGGGTAGSPGTAVLTIQGIGSGTAVPVSGTFFQATQAISIASGQVASGAFSSGSIASGALASGSISAGAASTSGGGAFPDGSVFVRSNAASTFPVTATIAASQTIAVTNVGTFAVQATLSAETTKVIGTVNQGTSPWVISGAVTTSGTATIVGTLTNNNAAPAATNVGVLSALANAASPSWTEGDQVLLSQDLSGRLRVVATGQVASGVTAAGNPVLVAGVSLSNGHALTIALDNFGDVQIGNGSALSDGQSNNAILANFEGSGLFVYPAVFNGSTWDRPRSASVGNAVAATGLDASVPYVQYNTTVPAPAATQYTAAQCDTTGSTYINTEGRKATYSAFASFTAVAGDIAVLPGSASKTIRVTRVEVSFTTSGIAAVEAVQLIKRSAADTGGTSASMTAVPHDSGFSGASAAPLNYTVAPTPGAAVGTIRGVQFNDASSAVPGANTWIWDFGARPSSAIVLRGVAQMLCINLPTAIATQTATVSWEWTEE